MNTWEDFDNEAKNVDKFTRDQEPVLVQLLQDAIGLFADAFSIENNSEPSNVAITKMSLLSHNFATLKCAVDLAMRGYYSQCNNLVRIVYENWLAFHYLTKYPDKAELLLKRTSKRLPDPSEMLDAITEDLNKKNLKQLYSALCCFAHPNAAGILPQISSNIVPEETTIHYGTTYKGNLFRASGYKICIWTGVMLDDIGQWTDQTDTWYQKLDVLVKRMLTFIDDENNKSK